MRRQRWSTTHSWRRHSPSTRADVYDYKGVSINEHRSAQTTVDTGLRWLDGVQAPSFLVLHFMEPHLDYEATDPHFGRFAPAALPAEKVDLHALVGASHGKTPPSAAAQGYIRQRYDEEILHVDDAIRDLVSQLKSGDVGTTQSWPSPLIMAKSSGITEGASTVTR